MTRVVSRTETSEIELHTQRLTAALRAVLEATPAAGLGPIEVARILGVDKTLTSRLMTALRAEGPLSALVSLPGTAPLRQFLNAAKAKEALRPAIEAADKELTGFDQTLQRTFGTRTHLDAVIADTLPEARRRHMESARQAVYRGIALIKGVSIDLASITWLFHPAGGGLVDTLVLASFSGIRRLRPTARVRFFSSYASGKPESGAQLLHEFCRPKDLSITVTRGDSTSSYEIATGPIRRDATSDIVLSEFIPAAYPLAKPSLDRRVFSCGDDVAHAYKRLTLTMLIHRDVWPGAEFELRAYDTAARGMVKLPDPEREIDRLEFDAPLVRFPEGVTGLRQSPVRGHAEMVQTLTAQRGWDVHSFRTLGCDVIYPLYGAQIRFVYEPPSVAP